MRNILAVGPGILFFPGAFASLGWVAGPVILLIFAFVTWYTSVLLAQTCDEICKNEEEDVEADVKLRLNYKAVVSRVLGTC